MDGAAVTDLSEGFCPACSLDDEEYEKQHQFFIAEETVIVCE